MIYLKTNYLGIELRNPVIVSSSGLSGNIAKIEKLAEAGAGAIVLKSVFEEQIRMETGLMLNNSDYPEAEDYIMNYSRQHTLDQYLELIKEARARTGIPVFGSINCVSAEGWISFAENIQQAGADALELNVFFVPNDVTEKGSWFENLYVEILSSVRKKISIPVAVKLGPYFSHLPSFVNSLYGWGSKGVVIFNRFYAPDINTDKMTIAASEVFSNPSDMRESLRWVAILSALIPKLDICASTGIHDGNAVIKQLLAGAKAVQVCSTLYMNGIDYLSKMLEDVKQWMKRHNFNDINEFRGRLNYKNVPDPMVFERVQFMKYFSAII
jgi:dihydroorotate dehydrogenase (fumarate)